MSGPAPPITVIIVDDHTLLCDGLRELLSIEPDIEVRGVGHSGQDAVALTERHRPDVVLLDVEMPGPPLRLVISRIHQAHPPTRVVILTVHTELRLIKAMVAAGAAGYLIKTVGREGLLATVRTVIREDRPTVLASSKQSLDAANLLQQLAAAGRSPLTPRESAVLELVARGMTNQEVAVALFIAEGTVRRHLGNAYRKLGARGRVDAINRAAAAGVISLPVLGPRSAPSTP